MHRTTRVSPIALWSVLLGLALASSALAQQPDAAQPPAAPQRPAEEVVPAPRSSTLVVPVNGVQRLQMTTRKPIRRVINEKDQSIRVSEVANDPTTILVTGLQPDNGRLTLTDADGTEETYQVVVQFDVEYLRTLLQRVVPTASITPIPGANQFIILTGTVAHAEDVEVVLRTAASVVGDKVINALRVGGVMQVQLDVTVARVNRSEVRRMGFNLLASGPSAVFGQTTGNITNVPTVGTVPPAAFASGAGGASTGGNNSTGLLTGGAISAPPGTANLFLGVVTNSGSFLGFLEALRDEGLAKILTQPKVVTLSGRPAAFVSGGEVPIPEAQGLGTTTVRFRPIGTTVNFLPVVLGNGKIYLEVEPEISRRNDANGIVISGLVVPGFDTQRVRAVVEIEPGQTLAIGGLIENETNASTRKTPILGDLPVIGAAFSVKEYRDIETELLVLVTPHLVDPMSCDQLPKLLPTMESRKPDDFELFLEGILEAPRGPRQVCPDGHYLPAFKNDPTAAKYPCAGGKCNDRLNNCENGTCVPAAVPVAPVQGVPMSTVVPARLSESLPVAGPVPTTPMLPALDVAAPRPTVPAVAAPVSLQGSETSKASAKPATLPEFTGAEENNVPK